MKTLTELLALTGLSRAALLNKVRRAYGQEYVDSLVLGQPTNVCPDRLEDFHFVLSNTSKQFLDARVNAANDTLLDQELCNQLGISFAIVQNECTTQAYRDYADELHTATLSDEIFRFKVLTLRALGKVMNENPQKALDIVSNFSKTPALNFLADAKAKAALGDGTIDAEFKMVDAPSDAHAPSDVRAPSDAHAPSPTTPETALEVPPA